MTIVLKKLDKTLLEEYLAFFENIRRLDQSDCGDCYCMFFHTNERAKAWVARTPGQNKADAIRYVTSGRLSGFLAFDGGLPVAWCNANLRSAFQFNKSRFRLAEDGQSAIALVCFYVMKSHRGRGILDLLLQHLIRYYQESGAAYLEAYPSTNKTSCEANYHGPLSSYLRNGFSIVREAEEVDDFGDRETFAIVRKYFP